MKAVILNSGLGKRMGALTENRHKCMVPLLNGETVFGRQLRLLAECGIKEFVITTGPYEEQLRAEAAKVCDSCNVTFIRNPIYDKTNYIYSLYLAREQLCDDVLLLHGDLVFDKAFVEALLAAKEPRLAAVNKSLALPEKDFKARLGLKDIREISVNIFDTGCFTFQPFYKLDRDAMQMWMNRIDTYVSRGEISCYAENALNELLPMLCLEPFAYENHFVEEIDTPEDYERVIRGIQLFDYDQQPVVNARSEILKIKDFLDAWGVKKPLLVCGKSYEKLPVQGVLDFYGVCAVKYQSFTPNPTYEQVVEGVRLFLREGCDGLISVGGGSAMDVAKCIKLFSVLQSDRNYLDQKPEFSPYKHLAIPTTAGTGSESTRFAVIYRNGEKQSVTHDCLLPDAAILDANLLRSLPQMQKVAGYCDALCHCVESMWSVHATKRSEEYAVKGLEILLENRKSFFEGSDKAAERILSAANLAGKAINITQTTAAHAMCYKLTSLYGLPHGCAAVLCLPAVWAHIAKGVYDARALEDSESYLHTEAALEVLCEKFKTNNNRQAILALRDVLRELDVGFPGEADVCEDLALLTSSVNRHRLKNCPVPMNEGDISKAYLITGSLYEPDALLDAELAAKAGTEAGEQDYGCNDDAEILGAVIPEYTGTQVENGIKEKLATVATLSKERIEKVLHFSCILHKCKKLTKLLYERALFRWYGIRYFRRQNTVVFDSFLGRAYYSNPSGIYEAMLKNGAYIAFGFVWSFVAPAEYEFLNNNPRTKLVEYGSRAHIKALATAKYIVSDVRLPRFAHLRKGQIYINTWHGKPIKRIGCDVRFKTAAGSGPKENRKKYRHDARQMTWLLSPAPFFTPHMRTAYDLKAIGKEDIIREFGYARNDYLFRYSQQDVLRVKMNLGIPLQKKVVLYAPTWRPTHYEKRRGYVFFEGAIDFVKLKQELGDDYIVLFRAHLNEARSVDFSALSDFVLDVTSVKNVNELYIISDLMVSDYSGTIFDFGNLKRPMVFYQYDREEYVNELTGTYVDLDELPGPVVRDKNELAKAIKEQLESFVYDDKYSVFNRKYNVLDGPQVATEIISTLIPAHNSKSQAEEWAKAFHKSISNFIIRCKGCMQAVGLRRSFNRERLLHFRNIHKNDRRCFLIGNGPSLTLEDLNLLKDEICFACNLIYKIYDRTLWRATYHCITDTVYSASVMDDINKSVQCQLFTNYAAYSIIPGCKDDIIYTYAVSRDPYYVHGNLLSYYVSSRATVMTFMIELAMYMGFKEIYLIGVDCSNSFDGKNAHFIRDYLNREIIDMVHMRAAEVAKGKQLALEEFGKYNQGRAMFAYSQLRKYADAHGVKIYNATRGGCLEEFERVDIDKVLANLSEEKLSEGPIEVV